LFVERRQLEYFVAVAKEAFVALGDEATPTIRAT
jgi:hypothetical protein